MVEPEIISISFCLFISIILAIVLFILLKNKDSSPSPSPSPSPNFSPWASPTPNQLPPPILAIQASDMSADDKALATISTLGIAIGIGIAQSYVLSIAGDLGDAICRCLYANESFATSMKGLILRYPKLIAFLSMDLESAGATVESVLTYFGMMGTSTTENGLQAAASAESRLSRLSKSAASILQELFSSLVTFEKTGPAVRVFTNSIAGRAIEGADAARAFGRAAGTTVGESLLGARIAGAGLFGEVTGGADAALIALTIINAALDGNNVGGYAQGVNAGDFLESKNQSDYTNDKTTFDSSGQYPIYVGPLDEIYSAALAASDSSTSLTSKQQTLIDTFNIDIQIEVSKYISANIGNYIDNRFGSKANKIVDPTLNYVFDQLFSSDATVSSTRLNSCAEPTTVSNRLVEPPVKLNNFFDATPPPVVPTSDLPPFVPSNPYVTSLSQPLDITGGQVLTSTILANIHNKLSDITRNLTNCDYLNLTTVAINNMCISKGGYVAENKYCSYNKTDCVSKQVWPIDPSQGQTYTEWRSNGRGSSQQDLDSTGLLDGNLDWYGANYPWKAEIDGQYVYSTGTKVSDDPGYYRDHTQPPYFDSKNGFFTNPAQYFDNGIRKQGQSIEPEGFCLARQFASRQACEERVHTTTGSGFNVYDDRTGICQNTENVCNARGLDFGPKHISDLGGDHGVKFPTGFGGSLNTCSESQDMKVANAILGGSTTTRFFNSLVLQGSSGAGGTNKPSNIPVIPSAGQKIFLSGSASVITALRSAAGSLNYGSIAISGTPDIIKNPDGYKDPEEFASQLTNIELSGISYIL